MYLGSLSLTDTGKRKRRSDTSYIHRKCFWYCSPQIRVELLARFKVANLNKGDEVRVMMWRWSSQDYPKDDSGDQSLLTRLAQIIALTAYKRQAPNEADADPEGAPDSTDGHNFCKSEGFLLSWKLLVKFNDPSEMMARDDIRRCTFAAWLLHVTRIFHIAKSSGESMAPFLVYTAGLSLPSSPFDVLREMRSSRAIHLVIAQRRNDPLAPLAYMGSCNLVQSLIEVIYEYGVEKIEENTESDAAEIDALKDIESSLIPDQWNKADSDDFSAQVEIITTILTTGQVIERPNASVGPCSNPTQMMVVQLDVQIRNVIENIEPFQTVPPPVECLL
ncbi:hypothetical protein F5050DRAFT_1709987 [Lentinula boryana]|uniref:Uncharacterized protein n=1 Tax=Lentinula boryana TaxID=40481 RepID=A0ABQ8QKB5_9AGAR|nr:hypothetical protein F5050DRAFT_1709987 [Lentinula boryana]